MSDTYTKTTTTSLGSRLGSSCIGVIVGIILFFAAFPLIFWNEGRAINRTKTLNEGQEVCVTVDPAAPEGGLEGKLVNFAGQVKTGETLSDPLFGQSVSNALQFARKVEMYQWVEHQKSETKKKTGGSTETTTTYTYKKEWVDHPVDSSSFEKPEGHENPAEWPVSGENWQVGSASIGVFELSDDQIKQAGSEQPYKPFVTNNIPLPQGLDGSYSRIQEGFYRASSEGASVGSPKVGDLKISFEVTPVCAVSFAGAKVGNQIKRYQTKFGELLLQYDGELNKEQIFAHAHRDNTILTWLLRIAGLLMFFFGLKLLVGPLNVLADIIPFIGNICDFITGAAAFLVALVLTLLTVAVAWIVVRPVLGIILIVIAVALIVWIKVSSKKQPASQPQQ